MIKPSLLLVSAVCFSSLFTEDNLEKKAQHFFNAGNYREAIHCYEDLMKEPKGSFQKEILHYNIATAYLADHQYEKAAQELLSVLSQIERCPKHLQERVYYNLALAQMGRVDLLLDEKDDTVCAQNLTQARSLIDEASENLKVYAQTKYIETDLNDTQSAELTELKNSLKELKSKWKNTQSRLVIEQLDFPKGIEKVKSQIQSQIEVIEHYFQPQFLPDFLRYALTREYVNAKRELPFWHKLKDLIGEMRKEAERKAQDASSPQESEETLQLQKAYEVFFNEAESGNKTALDCFKEHYLKRAWVELNKARWGLSFMQHLMQKEDLLSHCLKQKCIQKEKMSKGLKNLSYQEATKENIAYLNQVALSFSDQLIQSLPETQDYHQKALVKQLVEKLKERLKSENEPTLDKLEYDLALYQTLQEEPVDWLLPLYIQMETNKSLSQEDKKALAPKLFALKERFKIESQFQYGSIRDGKVQYAHKNLKIFEETLAQAEPKDTIKVLEDLMINLDYQKLVTYHLDEIQKVYDFAQKDVHFEDSYRKRIENRINRILAFALHLEEPDSYKEIYGQVQNGLEPLRAYHDMAQNSSYRNKLQKLFIKNASFSIQRLQEKLLEEKPTASHLLSRAVQEEKNSLENAEHTDFLHGVSEKEQADYFAFVKNSQDDPLQTIEPFEDVLSKEMEEKKGDFDTLKHYEEILKWFQAGKKEAQRAQELLKAPRIAWERVTKKQKNAIEYWEKALKAHQSQAQQSKEDGTSKEGEGAPSSGDQKEENQPSQKEQDSQVAQSDFQPAENSASEQDRQEMAQQQESRDLLQKLQEMQKDDELTPPEKKKAKRGLRPW